MSRVCRRGSMGGEVQNEAHSAGAGSRDKTAYDDRSKTSSPTNSSLYFYELDFTETTLNRTEVVMEKEHVGHAGLL